MPWLVAKLAFDNLLAGVSHSPLPQNQLKWQGDALKMGLPQQTWSNKQFSSNNGFGASGSPLPKPMLTVLARLLPPTISSCQFSAPTVIKSRSACTFPKTLSWSSSGWFRHYCALPHVIQETCGHPAHASISPLFPGCWENLGSRTQT